MNRRHPRQNASLMLVAIPMSRAWDKDCPMARTGLVLPIVQNARNLFEQPLDAGTAYGRTVGMSRTKNVCFLPITYEKAT